MSHIQLLACSVGSPFNFTPLVIIYTGFHGVMTRTANSVRGFSKAFAGRVGSVQDVSEFPLVGSGRVGSGRVGSGKEGTIPESAPDKYATYYGKISPVLFRDPEGPSFELALLNPTQNRMDYLTNKNQSATR